ncbi:MAG: hypothetical protein ABFQ95_02435 [Pseudomonadota bacterium]
MKNFFVNLSVVFVTLLLLALGAEVVLRFLPVYDGFSFLAVNDQNPTFRATPNRIVQVSKGWNFVLANKKNVNNAGFLNKQDYTEKGIRPLVAVVGDSYVEALQVTDEEPYFELLSQANPGVRVYSFGFSGAGLSQYLAWIKFAHDSYHNDYLIVNVVGNDYDESLKKYKFQRGFYLYDIDDNGDLPLVRHDWAMNPIIKLFHCSALARYLVYNLHVLDVVAMLKHRFSKQEDYAGNVAASVDQERENDSYRAVDAFLRDLPAYSGLSYQKVLFVIDADRSVVYNPSSEYVAQSNKTYVAKMSEYLKLQATKLGCTVIESVDVFAKDYQQHKQRFEFAKEADWHWNSRGHRIIAEAIQRSDWWRGGVSDERL